jgi:gentisate 1,2-dioxygenase
VWQVFAGEGTVALGERSLDVTTGDLIAVPSWQPLSWTAHTGLDLFTFSDAPVYEALRLARTQIGPVS